MLGYKLALLPLTTLHHFNMQLSSRYRPIARDRRGLLLGACAPWSSRAMARTGLRMMPTFPSPPLKFRTVGFPQYGFKASMSDGTFLQARNLKPAPGIRSLPRSLSPSFARFRHQGNPGSVSRLSRLPRAAVREAFPPYPRGPWLRFELYCLDPSSLTTTPCASPAGTLRFRVFALIRSAFAVRERLGDPRDLPYFHCRAFPACRRPYPGGPPCLPVILARRFQASSNY